VRAAILEANRRRPTAGKQALRLSEERFRLLVESVRDYAIFMLDPQGRVMSWNSGAELIKGYTADEVLGQHISIFYPAEKLRAGWPTQELEIAKAVGRFEDEGWRVRKDGSRFWANVVITALFDDGGTLDGFAKITRDLTQRRKIEALEESSRRMNDFLAMLAHELRNPLAPMSNAIQLLLSGKYDRQLVEWCSRVLDRQVKQLHRLVADLLDAHRITSGKIPLSRKTLDVRRIVEMAADSSRSLLAERRLHLDLPAEPVAVDGDGARLLQVFSNLIGNAVKFTSPVGVIECSVDSDRAFASIRVRDNGIGMPPHLLAVAFEPFTQGDPSLDRSDAGLGLGLAVVRRLVEMHDGTVRATSEGEGRGSEIHIRLPLADPRAIAGDTVSPGLEQLGRSGGLRILIVEDNRDSADSMAAILRMLGHEVSVAYDSGAALALAGDFAPDGALLDIGLPDVNGYELAMQLKALPGGADVALFALTGYGQDEDRRRAAEAGFARHFTKPVDIAELASAIEAECASRP